jgi:hypothetical protein
MPGILPLVPNLVNPITSSLAFVLPATPMSTPSALGPRRILIRTPTPTSIFAREGSMVTVTASTPAFPTLQYLDVSPLPQITLVRGAARFQVHPYSALHACLTGHGGTPTPASTDSGRDVEAQTNMRGDPYLLIEPFPELILLQQHLF